ncbi:LOW QUALITY PROTEIN: hypothetical protein HID58_059960 [Brassica napus]|uniref:Uncharacterized protein n=1 Tax=Brassica napus TaxID=3708 RepID=A0ABQ7ZUD6_BRANA|nr:LOW QUALITY PROTEIN: hypothetical protein HID58_059960 [Brassica napus]
MINRSLVLFGPLILVEDGELWASDDVLETVEPRALMFPEEEVALCLSSLPSYFLLSRRRGLELRWIGPLIRFPRILAFSSPRPRSSTSVPMAADRARLKGRMESPVSRSDSSLEAGEGSDYNLMAPLPLSFVYAAPSLVGHASSVGEDDELADWRSRYSLPSSIVLPVMFAYHLAPLNGGEGRFHLRPRSGLPIVEELPKNDRKGPVFNKKWQERNAFMAFPGSSHRWNFIAGTHSAPSEGEKVVLRARQLHADRRQETCREAAYQEAAKVMSAKKGSSSRSTSGDEVVITGSRRSPVTQKWWRDDSISTAVADIARSAGSLATALSNLNWNVFPQDGTVLSIGDSSEVVQVLQGGLLRTVSQLHHLGGRLSDEGLLFLREEVEVLKRQVSGEKEQRVAWEFEIRDPKQKIKYLEKVAEASSADALAVNQKNQELEEDIEALRAAAETFKFEMVMCVNGASVIARWELMRKWLRKQSAQLDLVTALEQYKFVVREEARSKGAPLPTFEDEPAIPPSFDMDTERWCRIHGPEDRVTETSDEDAWLWDGTGLGMVHGELAALAGRADLWHDRACRQHGRARRASWPVSRLSWPVSRLSSPATRPATRPCSPGELACVAAELAGRSVSARRHGENLSPESTLLVARCVKGLVLVSEGFGTPRTARDWYLPELYDLCEYYGTMDKANICIDLQKVEGDVLLDQRAGTTTVLSKNPSSSRLALISKRALVGWSRLNSSVFGNMEGSPYRKFSISRRKGSDPETEPGKLHSGEPGFLPAGILGTGIPSSGDPEAGVPSSGDPGNRGSFQWGSKGRNSTEIGKQLDKLYSESLYNC